MTISLPRLAANAVLVDENGQPTILFTSWFQTVATNLESAINSIEAIPEIQQALAQLDAATQAAQAAAAAANMAAGTAQSSATSANNNAKLANSYISPTSVLSATPNLITVTAHTRYYADGTSVSVNGGTVATTAPGDTDYVSYSDPTFSGGNVTYVVSTSNPAQVNGVHVVGAVAVPTSGIKAGGTGPQKPGTVIP